MVSPDEFRKAAYIRLFGSYGGTASERRIADPFISNIIHNLLYKQITSKTNEPEFVLRTKIEQNQYIRLYTTRHYLTTMDNTIKIKVLEDSNLSLKRQLHRLTGIVGELSETVNQLSNSIVILEEPEQQPDNDDTEALNF